MTRPALVIGLGGTGQWVLTYLKKDLLEIGNGKLPPGVRLLAFDTTKHASAVAGHESQAKKDPNEQRVKKAGAVVLDDQTEFVHFGSNLNQLANEINQNKHPQLTWFNATDAIRKLPEASLNADDGAGAIRHVGRLCLYKDVQSRTESKIINKIESAMGKISAERAVTVENRLEVIIVASLAGGTGAGLLVDIPMLCRDIAQDRFHGNIVVRGFIVTPRAFVSGAMGKGQEMLARSFAAWRELDRLLITSSEYGANEVRYSGALKVLSPRRLYDSTYVIDPQRETNPLDPGKPEEGLFPSIAYAISAMLDQDAGRAYSEQTINLSDTYMNLPLIPTHSAIGSYSMKVPVYYAQQKFTHELALETLDVLLAPRKNDQGRVVDLVSTKNAELTSQANIDLQAVLEYLSSDRVKAGEVDVANTGLLKLIARIRSTKAVENQGLLDQLARTGLSRSNSDFILALNDVGEDEQGKIIIDGISKELNFRVWQTIRPSREFGDTPEQAFGRMNQVKGGIDDVRITHYGAETAEGGLRGSFGESLEKVKLAQLRMFSASLRAWTEKTLNGTSVNPRMAKGGKLGYVQSFYKNLIDTLTYFNGFLDLLAQTRNSEQFKIEEKAKNKENNARNEYSRLKSKPCFLCFWDNFIHPDAYEAQREYLRAVQGVFDVRRDKILLAVLEETVDEMKAIATQTFQDINRWVVHLATGETRTVQLPDGKKAEFEVRSLYRSLQEELENIKLNHALDKGLKDVNKVIGEHTYQTDASLVEDRLRYIEWEVLRDEVKIPQADGSQVSKVVGLRTQLKVKDPKLAYLRNSGEEIARDNRQAFELLSVQPFTNMVQDHPFAVEVAKGDYNTGKKLAEHVNKKAEPFYRKTSTGVGPMHKPHGRSALIRVRSNINDQTLAYYDEFKSELESLDPRTHIVLVDSDDAYKQTIVRFDDVIKSQDFDIWERCRDAYLAVIKTCY